MLLSHFVLSTHPIQRFLTCDVLQPQIRVFLSGHIGVLPWFLGLDGGRQLTISFLGHDGRCHDRMSDKKSRRYRKRSGNGRIILDARRIHFEVHFDVSCAGDIDVIGRVSAVRHQGKHGFHIEIRHVPVSHKSVEANSSRS